MESEELVVVGSGVRTVGLVVAVRPMVTSDEVSAGPVVDSDGGRVLVAASETAGPLPSSCEEIG